MSEKERIITISLKDGEPTDKKVKDWIDKAEKKLNEILDEKKN